MSITYNKAVRDKIPELIESGGKKVLIAILNDKEFLHHLELKLEEEVTEYEKSKEIEELVDMVEVIDNILRIKGVTREEFERLREEKNFEKGSFTKNLFLIDVN